MAGTPGVAAADPFCAGQRGREAGDKDGTVHSVMDEVWGWVRGWVPREGRHYIGYDIYRVRGVPGAQT